MSSGIKNIESSLLLYLSKSSALATWPSSMRSPKKAITCGWENFNALEKVFSKYLWKNATLWNKTEIYLSKIQISCVTFIYWLYKINKCSLVVPIAVPSCYPWTKVILISFPQYLWVRDKKNFDALRAFAHGPLQLLYFIYEKFIVKYCRKNNDTNGYHSMLQPVWHNSLIICNSIFRYLALKNNSCNCCRTIVVKQRRQSLLII